MRPLRGALLLWLGLSLSACVPAPQVFDPALIPPAADLGVKNAATEWWYVSGYLAESGVAFHWAQFKVNYRGLPYHAGHVALTDLRGDQLALSENSSQNARFGFMPLRVQQGDWALREDAQGRYHLGAGPLNLVLTPLKGPVVHPPGYSGTPEVGRLYYQSVTRLAASGTVRIGGQARQVSGVVWLDHQWGDQQSGREALWDWFGLHLSDGSDLMLYRIRRANGEVVQVRGSRVDPAGAAHPVPDLVMTPGREWTSPSGRRYVLDWQVSGQGLDLRLAAVRDGQELLTKTTSVAYWEGPVRGEGHLGGVAVSAEGMGEFIGGVLRPDEGGLVPSLPAPTIPGNAL